MRRYTVPNNPSAIRVVRMGEDIAFIVVSYSDLIRHEPFDFMFQKPPLLTQAAVYVVVAGWIFCD